MVQHLGLNLGNLGSGPSGTSGLQSPPQTQHQQQQPQQQQQQQQQPGLTQPLKQPGQPILGAANPAPPNRSAPAAPPQPEVCLPNRQIPALGIPAPSRAAADAPAQPPAPANQALPVPDAQIITQQAAELVTLHARLAQLEAGAGGIPQRNMAAPPPVAPVLFADQGVIDRARAAVVVANKSDKKPSLPDIVPGFKANSLDVREYCVSLCSPPLSFHMGIYPTLFDARHLSTGVELLVARGHYSDSECGPFFGKQQA